MASFIANGFLFDSHSARGSRTPCPECGAVGTMTLSEEWEVKTEGFSLTGMQAKFPAKLGIRITCGAEDVKGCGWNALGEVEEGKLMVRGLKRRSSSDETSSDKSSS